MKFIEEIISRFGNLILKMIGSRKSFYQLLSKVIAIFILLNLKNEWAIIALYSISAIQDFVYFGAIMFEKVNTNINVGIGK